MRFFAEIVERIGREAGGVEYTVLGGRGGYFQNVKRITAFSSEEIVLRGGRDEVRILGSSLMLKRYGGGDVEIKGEIVAVERQAGVRRQKEGG